jgi:choline dehydrogenase-like flavoprotein
LFVCDGSLIPSSGIANTGLTIAALALRLAAHLRRRPYRTPEESRP